MTAEFDHITVTVPTGNDSAARAIEAGRERTKQKHILPVRSRLSKDKLTTTYDLLCGYGPKACEGELIRLREEGYSCS